MNSRKQSSKKRSFLYFLQLVSRFTLGLVFVYAGADKIINPMAFAETVHNYRILPDSAINLVALILPWLEVLIGICLLTGFLFLGATILVNFLLITFLLALTYNLMRGLNVNCGCFEPISSAIHTPSTWRYLARDGALFILALYLLLTIDPGRA